MAIPRIAPPRPKVVTPIQYRTGQLPTTLLGLVKPISTTVIALAIGSVGGYYAIPTIGVKWSESSLASSPSAGNVIPPSQINQQPTNLTLRADTSIIWFPGINTSTTNQKKLATELQNKLRIPIYTIDAGNTADKPVLLDNTTDLLRAVFQQIGNTTNTNILNTGYTQLKSMLLNEKQKNVILIGVSGGDQAVQKILEHFLADTTLTPQQRQKLHVYRVASPVDIRQQHAIKTMFSQRNIPSVKEIIQPDDGVAHSASNPTRTISINNNRVEQTGKPIVNGRKKFWHYFIGDIITNTLLGGNKRTYSSFLSPQPNGFLTSLLAFSTLQKHLGIQDPHSRTRLTTEITSRIMQDFPLR